MKQYYEKILVVGGGIGGLAAGIALRQAGCEVDLIELHDAWATAGVGIIQPSNALRALDALGVAQACLDSGYPYDRYKWFNAEGQFLFDAYGPIVANHLPAYNGLSRPKLQEILVERALAIGVKIQMGVTIAALNDTGDDVQVTLSNGRALVYSAVVGADGIYSKLRGHLFGDTVPQYTGQSAWRMAMPRPDDVRWGAMVVGAQAKAGLIPLSKSDMYLLLVTQEDPSVFLPVDQLDQILRDRLAGFGGLIKELAALIVDPAQVVYRPMQIVMLPEPWHSGRIVLIGDAAHASTPHLGQGAAMAIEDAVVLGELIGQQLPWEDVTEQYMKRRFSRAMHIQNASFEVGEYEQGRRPNLNVVSVIDEAKAAAAAAI